MLNTHNQIYETSNLRLINANRYIHKSNGEEPLMLMMLYPPIHG